MQKNDVMGKQEKMKYAKVLWHATNLIYVLFPIVDFKFVSDNFFSKASKLTSLFTIDFF